jgi:hypothetical protein
LGERLNGIQEVDGSIPFSSTNDLNPRLASPAHCLHRSRPPIGQAVDVLTALYAIPLEVAPLKVVSTDLTLLSPR